MFESEKETRWKRVDPLLKAAGWNLGGETLQPGDEQGSVFRRGELPEHDWYLIAFSRRLDGIADPQAGDCHFEWHTVAA